MSIRNETAPAATARTSNPPPSVTPHEVEAAYFRLRDQLLGQPMRVPGRVQFLNWDLEYVSGPAVVSAVENLVLFGLNDFVPEHEHPTILDCGSNIGIGVLNYKRQFPGARIVAFEADPEFAPVLARNLQRNGAADVQVVEAAVWTQDGEAQWYCEGADGSRLKVPQREDARVVTVRTVDLGRYLRDEIDLLKLDVEGAEFELVASLGGKLSRVKNMIVECHLHPTDVTSLASLLNTLADAGFQIAINTLSAWRDLVRQPEVPQDHFGLYLLVAAWREPIPPSAATTWKPLGGDAFMRAVNIVQREAELARREAVLAQREHAYAMLPWVRAICVLRRILGANE